MKLSIIIPVGPNEDQLAPLLEDLEAFAGPAEIILVTCAGQVDCAPHMQKIYSVPGRAIQQNAGARAAKGEFLWFLHADSRVNARTISALMESVMAAPDALHYFHLKFLADGPRSMTINEGGARFRSQILGLPFGDQGFCLRRQIFDQIGGFAENVTYGEDHLLVWRARQAGVRLRCTGAELLTSARKYCVHGWGKLMLKYQYLWMKQALPEFWKLLRIRLKL